MTNREQRSATRGLTEMLTHLGILTTGKGSTNRVVIWRNLSVYFKITDKSESI